MQLRPYRPADREHCLALFDANAPEHFGVNERPEFAAYLDAGPEHFQVTEEGAAILACGGIETYPERTEAEFRWVMAAPAVRGQGFGKRLMLESADYLRRETSIRRILVYTTPGSAGFFRKLGFPAETVRTEPDYWTKGLHLELLCLKIG